MRAFQDNSNQYEFSHLREVALATPNEAISKGQVYGLHKRSLQGNSVSWTHGQGKLHHLHYFDLSNTRKSWYIAETKRDEYRAAYWNREAISKGWVPATPGPLGNIFYNSITEGNPGPIWFHFVFNRDTRVAEIYLNYNGVFTVWELLQHEYQRDERGEPELVPELQVLEQQYIQQRMSGNSTHERGEFLDNAYPEHYPTYWTRVSEYSVPFDGPFHAIPLDQDVYLLNTNGEVFRVDPDEIVELGHFENWRTRDGDAEDALILLEEPDTPTASVVEIVDGEIRHLPFTPAEPEIQNPFSVREFKENETQAIKTLRKATSTPVPVKTPVNE